MKKTLRIAGIPLAALLVVSAALLVWALHTESGARGVLGVARHWLPAGLNIGELRGTIGSTLHITDFHYRDDSIGMDLRIQAAELEFSPFALFARRLHVGRAQVDGVTLALFPATVEPPAKLGAVRDPWVAPLDMLLDDLQITRAELRQATSPPTSIQRAHLAGSWIGANIVARELTVEGPDGQVKLALQVGARAPKLQQLSGKFRWRLGDRQWAGSVEAGREGDELRLKAALEAPLKLDLAGTLAVTRIDRTLAAWRAHLAVARFDPRPLLDTEAFKTAALDLDASGDLSGGGRATLRGVLSLDKERVIIERLDAARHEQVLQISALRLRLNSQPAALTGSMTLALDASSPSSARLAWEEFKLPAAWMGPEFRSSGQLALTTRAQRFALNGSARLARAKKRATLSLRVDGSQQALHIQEFELTQMPGSLSVAGNVDLTAAPRWQLTAKAREFDPALLLDQWPGALDFELQTSGEWPESGPRARFQLPRLAGRLRGRAISAAGDITIGQDRVPSGNLQMHSGGTSLTATASGGARPRLEAALKVAALHEWTGRLSGAVDVQATATGRWPDVDVDASFSASGVHGGDTQVDSAKGTLAARDARAPRGKLELSATGLAVAGMHFDDLHAKLDGDQKAHTLGFEARGEALTFALHTSGALQRAGWSGVIDKLGVTVAQVPPLALAEPAHLVVTHSDFAFDKACMAGGNIMLCAGARRTGGDLQANYSIKALPLSLLAALAAPGSPLSIDGLLEGSGELRRSAGGVLSGHATLASPTGAFAQGKDQGAGPDALRLEYRDFGVDLEMTPSAAQARLRGVLLKQGDVSGSFSMAMGQADPALTGNASVKLRDLAPLGWWVPQLANLRGSGELAAQLSGTLGAPRVAVSARATGLDAEVPVLGVHLRDGNVNANLEPTGAFQADGSLGSGDGTVRLTGGRNSERALELKIAGSKFLAANIPGARVVIAPELSLTGTIGALALAGSVKIEDADVNLEKLSIDRSYSASPDVVVVDREMEIKDRSPGLTTDVRVLFGERVKIAGLGLDSTVSGELRVYEGRDEPSRATGEIRLAGTYEAFGRKLNIERGKLMFAGTTLDDPQLDILAVRKLQDVTAKLSITGTAQHPKLDVFTDPAMSQTDAMSYLLTGKPASDVHGEEGATVQSASQNAGLILGNRLAKKLGGKVGFIDEVGVEQNNDLGGSAFTVGKYLSPKLFVSYGVGLFEPGSAVTVRYEFTKHWSLEASDTPDDQHAGVRYRIEK